MKKTTLIILLCLCFFNISSPCFCEDILEATYAQNAAEYTNYKNCIRLYKLPYEKLYYLALSSIPASKFEIVEMQSRNGYIIFQTDNREFLLSIFKKDKNYTFIRLTPCDNNYYFSPSIVTKIFNYIDIHFNEEVKQLKM